MLPIQVSGRPGPQLPLLQGDLRPALNVTFSTPRAGSATSGLSVAGPLAKQGRETCRRSPPPTNTPGNGPGRVRRVGLGAGTLPAVCNELIHQLSHQGVHVLGGALRLQGQVDLLQAGFLGKGGQESRWSLQGEGARWTPGPSPVTTPSP